MSVTYLRRGMISILDVIAVKLPQVFTAEILPKLDMKDTLNLAQVNKAYNAAVWSADGVRSMEAKIKPHRVKIEMKNWSTEPLYWAAKHGNVPAVKALLESGEDVNRRIRLEGAAEYCTALHIAAEHGHVAATKVLIEAGADVNALRAEGNTPLYDAVYFGENIFRPRKTTVTVALLINAGADVNLMSNHEYRTPLSFAVAKGNITMVTLLIQAGADVNKADKDGQTPLTLAEKRDTLIKSRREKRRELVERNQDYRNALRCDPYFFPKMGTDTHGYSPQDAIWRMDICSDAILDMLCNAEYMRSESKK